jgi:hypothetical protein
MVEQDFTAPPAAPESGLGSLYCRVVTAPRDAGQVVWIHIYMSQDRKKSYCVYDAPSPEAVLHALGQDGLPVPRITEITSLNHYS